MSFFIDQKLILIETNLIAICKNRELVLTFLKNKYVPELVRKSMSWIQRILNFLGATHISCKYEIN